MLLLSVIGNLGADAKVISANGRTFVSFNVAQNDKYKDANGVEHEETTWISCAYNGKADNILPWLRKGKQVFCMGRCSVRVYDSPKAHTKVAGINMSVERIELLGGGEAKEGADSNQATETTIEDANAPF